MSFSIRTNLDEMISLRWCTVSVRLTLTLSDSDEIEFLLSSNIQKCSGFKRIPSWKIIRNMVCPHPPSPPFGIGLWGLPKLGEDQSPCPHTRLSQAALQFLAKKLTLSKPGGHYAHHSTTSSPPPDFQTLRRPCHINSRA